MTRHRNLSSRFGEEKVTKSKLKVTKSVTKSVEKVTKSKTKVTKSVTMSMEKVTKSKTMTPDLDTRLRHSDTNHDTKRVPLTNKQTHNARKTHYTVHTR